MKLNLWIVLFLCLGSFLNAMEQQEETIPFETGDGKIFYVKKEIAANFSGIRALISGDFVPLHNQETQSIPFNEIVKNKAFKTIVDFYEGEKDINFFKDFPQKKLIKVINAAHYLDCEEVLRAACKIYTKKLFKYISDAKGIKRHKKLLIDVDHDITNAILNKKTENSFAIYESYKVKHKTQKVSLKENILTFILHKTIDVQDKSLYWKGLYNCAETGNPLIMSPKGSYLVLYFTCGEMRLLDLRANVLKDPLMVQNVRLKFCKFARFYENRNVTFDSDESLYCGIYSSGKNKREKCLVVSRTINNEICMKQEGDFVLPGFSSNNTFLAAVALNKEYEIKAAENAHVCVWDLSTSLLLKKLPTIFNKKVIQNYAFSSQNALAYLKNKTTLAVWHPSSNREIEVPSYGNCYNDKNNYHIYEFSFSQDGTKLIFLSSDRVLDVGPQQQYVTLPKSILNMYDIKNDKLCYYEFENEKPFDLGFSQEGKYFFTSESRPYYTSLQMCNYDRFLKVFSVDSFEDTPYVGHRLDSCKRPFLVHTDAKDRLGLLECMGRKIFRGYARKYGSEPNFGINELAYINNLPKELYREVKVFDAKGKFFFVNVELDKEDEYHQKINIWGPTIDPFQLEEDVQSLSSEHLTLVQALLKRKDPLLIEKIHLPSGKKIPMTSPVISLYKSLPKSVKERLYGKVIEKDVKAILVRGTSSETYAVSGLKNNLITRI